MQIPSTTSFTTLLSLNSALPKRHSPAGATVAAADSSAKAADQTTISEAARKRAAEEAASTGTYDFTNMTPQLMEQAMNTLIGQGKLSLEDAGQLIGLIPSPLSKVNYDGAYPAAYHQPTDFLAGLTRGLEGERSRGNLDHVEYISKALNALQRLQGTKIEA